MTTIAPGASATSHVPLASHAASNSAALRMGAILAGGSLVISSATLLSIAGDFPHPEQQAGAALLTLVLGLIVAGSAFGISEKRRGVALLQFGAYTLVVITLLLIRYVPPLYIFTYLHDIESFSPPLWPYSLSIPLLMAVLGELLFSGRPRTRSVSVPIASLLPAAMVLLFGSEIVGAMAATFEGFALPWRTLLALAVCIGISASIVLGAVAATRGAWLTGALVLVAVGLGLEAGSTFFYGSASPRLFDLGVPDISPWLAIAAGTVPGALTLLLSVVTILQAPNTHIKEANGK